MPSYEVAIQLEMRNEEGPKIESYKVELCSKWACQSDSFYKLGEGLSMDEAEAAARATVRALKALDPDCNIKATRPL